ncbi:17534_t:CDS:1 [Gigaspora rosea]|nr:17534_t:CDS:1 [Gigaspora rosea]
MDKSDKSQTAIDRLKLILQEPRTHWLILLLVALDFLCYMTMIIISYLWPAAEQGEHWLFETLLIVSFTIDTIFLLEITLNVFAFGFLDYFIKSPHWLLHIFDSSLVVTAFLLEIFLHGKQREVLGLLIVFRFWRLIKVIGTVAVGVGTYDEQKQQDLINKNEQLSKELERIIIIVEEIAKEDHWSDERMEKVFRESNY